jgi:hypothetical protein
MLVVNNSPPASGNYCCGVVMNASSVRGDTPRAAAMVCGTASSLAIAANSTNATDSSCQPK